MNAYTPIVAERPLPSPKYRERWIAKSERCAVLSSTMSEMIWGLNAAAKRLDELGHDGSVFREIAEKGSQVRWAR